MGSETRPGQRFPKINLAMRARTHRTKRMSYHKFNFLIHGNNRPLSIKVIAIDLEAARADVRQAYGDDVEIITVSCDFS